MTPTAAADPNLALELRLRELCTLRSAIIVCLPQTSSLINRPRETGTSQNTLGHRRSPLSPVQVRCTSAITHTYTQGGTPKNLFNCVSHVFLKAKVLLCFTPLRPDAGCTLEKFYFLPDFDRNHCYDETGLLFTGSH